MGTKTVFEKILSECEGAVLNGKPIIVLRTNEMELVNQLVSSDRLVVRLTSIPDGGVDQQVIKPTRYCETEQHMNLFLAGKSTADGVNFNIHYIPKDKLKNFVLEDEENYGIPQCAAKYTFPSLYVIQYQRSEADPLKMWDSANLNAFIDRYLQESMSGSCVSSSIILIYGEDTVVPAIYENYCEIIDEPYPEVEEIKDCLFNCDCFADKQNPETVNIIADALLGLPIYQIKRLIRSLSIIPIKGTDCCILSDEKKTREEIQKYKSQILKKSNLLELIPVTSDGASDITGENSSIGGMNTFKAWISSQERSIKEGDSLKRDVGAYPPKGVLLCGIPGCGKSMAVQSVAETLKIPLLKLDIGQLMGKYVGESEHNMTKALKIAEAMAPCVLFIDELDKGFGGAGKNNDDSGPFKRMFGTLLGWMQDCKKPCFIFATANDISALPKEFFRSGRFDCLYSLYMPTATECIDIFVKQMKRAEKNTANEHLFASECYDKDSLSTLINSFVGNDKCRFVTGADIAKLVSMALRTIWNNRYDSSPISWNEWSSNIVLALQNTTVYGDSKENLDSIATCYIRLLRSNFLPASDDPLFTSENYEIITQKPADDEPKKQFPEYEIRIKDNKNKLSLYDSKMRETLVPIMETYGAIIEEYALRRMF